MSKICDVRHKDGSKPFMDIVLPPMPEVRGSTQDYIHRYAREYAALAIAQQPHFISPIYDAAAVRPTSYETVLGFITESPVYSIGEDEDGFWDTVSFLPHKGFCHPAVGDNPADVPCKVIAWCHIPKRKPCFGA